MNPQRHGEWGADDPIGSFLNSKKGENPLKRDLQNRQLIAEGAIARLLESKAKANQAQISDYKADAGDAMIARTHYRKTMWNNGFLVLSGMMFALIVGGLFVGKWIMFAPFMAVIVAFLFSPQLFFWKNARDNIAGDEVYKSVRAVLFPKRLEFFLLFGLLFSPLSIISWWFMRENTQTFTFINKILLDVPHFFWQYLNTNHVSYLVAVMSFFIMIVFHIMQISKT